MEAAYRFFDNDDVTPQKILQPHINEEAGSMTYGPPNVCLAIPSK
jgi:hypothetical protein